MKPQVFVPVVACVAVVIGVTGTILRADEPAQSQAPASEPVQIDVSHSILSTLLVDAADDNYLDLVTATYGNPLAVEVADLEAALRTQLGTKEGVGVVVTSVGKEPEEAAGGLEKYDVVLQLGEEKVASPKQFHELVGSKQDKAVEFHVIRKGKPIKVSVTIPKRPVYQVFDTDAAQTRSAARWLALAGRNPARFRGNNSIWKVRGLQLDLTDAGVEQRYRIGVTLSEADDPLRSQLRLAAGEGLVVTEVVNDSPAAGAGIQKNDVLVKLDGKRLTTVDAVNTQVQEIKDRKVTVALFRAGNEIVCEVTPRLSKEPSYRHAVLNELNSLIELRDAAHAERAAAALFLKAATEPAAGPTPVEQLAAMKKQIGELQKSLEMLEAALQSAAPAKPAAPEEKK